MNTAFLNGKFLPLSQATVPVLDRGFLFADAVYEVIPVYAGKAFLLDEHLQRLSNSLAAIRLTNPYACGEWTELLQALVKRNGSGDLSIYLQVTRGAAPRRDHRMPADPAPTVVAFCQTRNPPDPAIFSDGVPVVTMEDNRWRGCHIKSTSLLANILASDDAAQAGAAEAVFLRDGWVMEGASSNVFAVVNGRLKTPPLRPEILPGITRGLLLQLACKQGIDCEEADISAAELVAADEIWLTSSIREIYPVTQVNEQAVGTGKPGPVWARMRELIQNSYA